MKHLIKQFLVLLLSTGLVGFILFTAIYSNVPTIISDDSEVNSDENYYFESSDELGSSQLDRKEQISAASLSEYSSNAPNPDKPPVKEKVMTEAEIEMLISSVALPESPVDKSSVSFTPDIVPK